MDADEKAGSQLFQLPPETIEAAALLADAIYHESPVDPVDAAIADLAAAADVESVEGPLRRLSDALLGADELRRSMARERAIKEVKRLDAQSPASLVDAALGAPARRRNDSTSGTALLVEDPDPWPYPVDGSALLRELASVFDRFVALPGHAATAIVLWTLHAHALEAADCAPILALTSPEKQCGKTRTLSLLGRLVPRPLLTSNISPASVFRIVEKYSPTLLVDEADTFLGTREELRGILNSGHTRDAAYVVRTTGDDHEPRRFSTWGAKAVALIGRLPDTLTDRSIVVPMRRRAPHEQIERLRVDRTGTLEEPRRRAARWAADRLTELDTADPDIPSELGDRAADNWRPLLAISDLAGGDWPERARRAAVALSGAAVDAPNSMREQLLADIRDVFRERDVDRIFSQDLLQDLCSREERPWGEWGPGRANMSPRQLSTQLKPFGVQPRPLRDGAKTGKGYTSKQFSDAFARYIPANPSHPSQSSTDGGLGDSAIRHTSEAVTDCESGSNPYGTGVVTDVTDQDPAGADWQDVE